MRTIKIQAPAHLHAGNLDLTGDLGRLYGTVGFTIKNPQTIIEASKAEKLIIEGEDTTAAKKYAEAFMRRFQIRGGAKINIKSEIPKHVGMGSQTALALSIGVALAELYRKKVGLDETALALGRSDTVALGLNSFRCGGFIVDGGFSLKEKRKKVPPLLFRHPIPEDWSFVVCIPIKPMPEILKIKEDEDNILRQLKKMPAGLSDRLSRIILMQAMPAIIEEDITSFSKAIMEFNSLLGGFWGTYQSGRVYCHQIVEEGIQLMLKNGAYGACQTCWGPTFYGITDNRKKSVKLVSKMKSFLKENGGGKVFVTKGDNIGAKITKR